MRNCLLAIFVIAIVCSCALADGELRAGIAMADISPPVGVPLAGYSSRRLEVPDFDPETYHSLLAPSDGVLDPLISKVLVLESGGSKVAIVKLDVIGIPQKVVKDVAKKIEAATGIDIDHLALTGTHTHSGPGAMSDSVFWSVAAVDLFDARIYDPFVERLAQLIIEANSNLQPARIGVGTALSFEHTKNRRNHPGVFDPVVGVFKVEKLDGTTLAVLFNFAIHGSCYGSANLKMSGDVSGHAERHIETVLAQRQGQPVMAMFTNGTEGDVSPIKKGKHTNSLGMGIGDKVLEAMATIATERNVSIAVANRQIHFAKAHLNFDLFNPPAQFSGEIDCWGIAPLIEELFPEVSLQRGPKLRLEVTGLVPARFRLQAICIGNAVIACVPGEPITNIGTSLKAIGGQLGFRHTFVFGLANGHMGYITDQQNFDEGGYEAMLSLYGRDEGMRIVEAFAGLFAELAEDQ